MTDVTIGWGGEFWLDDANGVLSQLQEIISTPFPNPQVADVEATHMKSPNRRREYIAGLIEDGEGTVEMNYIPGSPTDTLIRAALNDGVTRSFKVITPIDAAAGDLWEITGDCIVKGYERTAPIDDRKTATMTIRFTGTQNEAAS